MARKRLTVEQWIIEALSDPDKGGPCTTLSLVFVKPSGSHEEVHSKNLTGATHNAKQLADFFTSKASGFAQDLPGIQNFRLHAFYNGSNQPQSAFPFTVIEGEMSTGPDLAYARHEPTERGLLGQLMKHLEENQRMMMNVMQTVTVQAVTREQNMRGELAEAQGIVREVLLDMTKQAHQNRMDQLKYLRETEERALIGKALPAMVNQLTGRELLPQSHVDSQLIDALALKVKPEHLEMLTQMGMLDQQQATMLAARFAQTLERKQQETAVFRSLPGEESESTAIEPQKDGPR